MYLPPCRDFLNNKIPGFSENTILHSIVLQGVVFDSSYYYKNNDDLHNFFEEDDEKGLWTHYIQSGWAEGRFPFEVIVDEIFYLETYPDVINFDGSYQDHFVRHGYSEGRLPYMFNIDLKLYNQRLSVIDPKAEPILDNNELRKHFVLVGYHQLYR